MWRRDERIGNTCIAFYCWLNVFHRSVKGVVTHVASSPSTVSPSTSSFASDLSLWNAVKVSVYMFNLKDLLHVRVGSVAIHNAAS